MVYLSMLFHCCMFSCSALRFLIVYPFAPSNVSSLHFLLTLRVLIVFLLGGMTFSNSLLFHWFYYVFFFSSSTSFVKFFRTNFCYLLCFSKKSKQFPCKCEHWTESIYECRQPRCKTFTKWTNENVLWRRKYDATPQTNRLEQLAGVFCVVFFSSFIIFTNCFLSHIKLAVLL